MNIEMSCEIVKVEPAVTAGKDEAPRRFLKLTLERHLHPELARALNAEEACKLVKDGSLSKATVPIDRLQLRGTFQGVGRGLRQGTIAMQMRGVVAKVVPGGGEEAQPMVKLTFDLDYSEAWAVFLMENLRSGVELKLEDSQLDNGMQQPGAWDDSDDPTKPEDPPKAKKGKKATAPEKPKKGKRAKTPNGESAHDTSWSGADAAATES